MKVGQLIKELEKLDPELQVCFFSDNGAHLIEQPYVLRGWHEDSENYKLVFREKEGTFVAINNYADFDLEHRTYEHLD